MGWRRMAPILVAVTLAAGCGSDPAPAEAPGGGAAGEPAPAGEAPERPATLEELALYQGADRLQILEEGARKEGALTVYDTIPAPTFKPILDAFTAKYGIPVELWRATAVEVIPKVQAESKAGRPIGDVVAGMRFDGTEALAREGILIPVWSQEAADWPADRKDPEGRWIGHNINFLPAVYNTQKVAKDELPRKYEELLHPRWRGRLAAESTSERVMMTLATRYFPSEESGIQFFRDLTGQRLVTPQGHSKMIQQIVAGEIDFGMATYNYLVQNQKKEGAPVDWHPIEPVIGDQNAAGVVAGAPHPHAALLFLEFLLSEEGQRLHAEVGLIPADPDVPADPPELASGFETLMVDPAQLLDEFDKWQGLYDEIVVGSGRK